MTVTTTTARNVKAPNGSTTSFPFDFAFEAEGDLIVTRVVTATGVETLQILTTDYTVTGGSGATGTIEMVTAPPGPSLETLVIERSVAFTQAVDYQRNDPFPAEVNETALDKLTFLVQQVQDLTQRALRLTKSTTLTDVTFPDPEVDKILVGKTTTEFENKAISDIDTTVVALPVSIANGGTNAITAAAARVNLDTQQDLDVPSQAEAEAGTATTERVWTAQRVGQSIAALSPSSNLIINGEMSIAQRGASFATLTASQYTLDRWEWVDAGTTAGAVTITQDTDVPTVAEAGIKFVNSLKIDVTTAEDLASGDAALFLSHKIEAQNSTIFGHGAAGALAAKLSFWFKSTKTGVFTVNIDRDDASEKFSTEFTVATTNTWEKHTVTIPGDTSGTAVADDTGVGLVLQIMMAIGSTGTTSTPDAWNASGATELATSNQVNLLDNTSNSVFITGVQYKLGNVETQFTSRGVQQELSLCERYTKVFAGPSEMIAVGQCFSTTQADVIVTHAVTMRAAPALVVTAAGDFLLTQADLTSEATTTLTMQAASLWASRLRVTVAANIVAGNATLLGNDATAGGQLTLDAEL